LPTSGIPSSWTSNIVIFPTNKKKRKLLTAIGTITTPLTYGQIRHSQNIIGLLNY
jgi:hypothetical protein